MVISFAPEPTSRLQACFEMFFTDMLMSKPAPTFTACFLIETFTLTSLSEQVPGGCVLVATGDADCSAIGSTADSCDGVVELTGEADADGLVVGELEAEAVADAEATLDFDGAAIGVPDESFPPKTDRPIKYRVSKTRTAKIARRRQ